MPDNRLEQINLSCAPLPAGLQSASTTHHRGRHDRENPPAVTRNLRIRAELLDTYEMNVNHKLVSAIMTELGIAGLPRSGKRKPNLLGGGHHRPIVEQCARIAGQGEFGFECGDAVPGRCELVGLDARYAVPHSRIDQGLVFPPKQRRRRYAGFRRNIGDCVTGREDGARSVDGLSSDRTWALWPPADHSASSLV